MAVIDVGSAAIDRASSTGGYTYVDINNPANDTGTLDTVEIYLTGTNNSAGVKVATFYVVSGNYLTTRSYASLGAVTAGSKQTFTGLSISVSSNDYLGVYPGALPVNIERDTSGSGYWGLANDNIPCTNKNFGSATSSRTLSIYATGATAEAASNPPFRNIYPHILAH